MKILYAYLIKYWKLVALALLLASINQVFSLLDPYIFRFIIDDYVTKFNTIEQSVFIKGVLKLLGLAVTVAFISRVAKNFQDYFVNVITQKIGTEIYANGLSHSLRLPYQVFEDQRSGETLGILQKAKSDSEKLINAFVNILFTTLVGIVFVMIYAFKVHWIIAPIYLLTIPLLGIISSYLGKKIKKMQKIIVSQTTALAGSTTESLRNIELVKSLGLADQEIDRLNQTNTKILGLELNKVKYLRSLSFIQGTTVNLIRTSILFIMLFLIYKGEISTGQFFSLFIYSFFIFGPLQELGNIINIYREAQVSLENLNTLFQKPVEEVSAKGSTLKTVTEVAFKNVSFTHLSASKPAVNHINFKLKAGETIAFVGPSGAGKTTLIKMLVGLYRASEGTVCYNGIDAKEIQLDHFRNLIGYVTQDTQLFAGSIKDNLKFVKPSATDEECYNVLQMAACGPLLERAQNGINTLIGEGGVKVSGGEKQRLAIARALLRDPSLIIFDEATSALDSLTEEEITETIKSVSTLKKHLVVLIAHRLSTIMHADRIYVLEKGNMVEQGTHAALIAEKGLYYAMWRQQAGEA